MISFKMYSRTSTTTTRLTRHCVYTDDWDIQCVHRTRSNSNVNCEFHPFLNKKYIGSSKLSDLSSTEARWYITSSLVRTPRYQANYQHVHVYTVGLAEIYTQQWILSCSNMKTSSLCSNFFVVIYPLLVWVSHLTHSKWWKSKLCHIPFQSKCKQAEEA